MRIPELVLSRQGIKTPAEVEKRVPELILQTRRGWKGGPLPFDSVESALAWGNMRGPTLKKDNGIAMLRATTAESNAAQMKGKYKAARRGIRELRADLTEAANGTGDHVKRIKKIKKSRPRLALPGRPKEDVEINFNPLSASSAAEDGVITGYRAPKMRKPPRGG